MYKVALWTVVLEVNANEAKANLEPVVCARLKHQGVAFKTASMPRTPKQKIQNVWR